MKRYQILASVLAVALVMSACGSEDRKAAHLQKGKDFVAVEDFEKARIEFKNVLQIDPKDAAARYELGKVLMKLQEWRGAAGQFKGAIDLDPGMLEARVELARLFLLGGAGDDAKEQISEILATDENHVEALVMRAVLKVRSGEVDGAREDALKALEMAPDNEQAINTLARIYVSEGELDKGRKLLEDGVRTHQESVALRGSLAALYEQEGDTERVLPILREIINLQPDASAPRLTLAKYLNAKGMHDELDQVLSAAVTAIPDDDTLKFTYADYLYQKKGSDSAIQELNKYLAADPGNNELRFKLATYHVTEKDFEAAKKVYDAIIQAEELNPDGLKARGMKAQLLMAQKNVEEAMTLVEEVLKENPQDTVALSLRGAGSLMDGDAGAAILDFRSALKNKADSAQISSLLAKAHLINKEPELAAQTLHDAVEQSPTNYSIAQEYIRLLSATGKSEQAMDVLKGYVDKVPGNSEAKVALGRAYVATKKYPEALALGEEMKTATPTNSTGYMFVAGALAAEGDVQGAITEMEKAYAVVDDKNKILPNLIKGYLSQQQQDKAAQLLDTEIESDPTNYGARNLRGELYLFAKDYDSATQEFSAVVAADPKQVVAHRNLALTHLSKGDSDASIQAFQDGLDSNPESTALMYGLVGIYEKTGKYAEAIARYESILETDPTAALPRNNLAMMLVSFKSDDQQSLDRALELVEPLKEADNAAFLDTVGWVHYQRGEYQEALPYLEKAVEGIKESPLLRYHLGMAYQKSGNDVLAREHLQQAVESETEYMGKEEAVQVLSQLTGG